MVGAVPGHKSLQTILKAGAGLKAYGLVEGGHIGMGLLHIPGLHGHEFHSGLLPQGILAMPQRLRVLRDGIWLT